MDLATLDTPAALVDLDVMRANLARLDDYCRRHGLAWRPHTKTHKSPVVAAAQLQAGASGLTVATLREAEVMAPLTEDLLLAYPPVGPDKLARLLRLEPWPARLTVALDSLDVLEPLGRAAIAAGREVGVVVELDAGMHRVGVQSPEDVVRLAAAVARTPGVRYEGVMFYPGHIRERSEQQSLQLLSLSVILDRFFAALSEAGLSPRVVSGGSTPTIWRSHEIPGLTEVRAGTTVFCDRTTAAIGVCEWSDCAYSVLATVVSTAVPGQVVIDAGSKALSKEELRGEGGGFGALLDRPDVVVSALSEEHGLLDLTRTAWRPAIGERVRVVPNHVCVSVNLQEQVWGVERDVVVTSWPVAARGR
jgi:D-serine deaminase-like pyridoxal phosphate-dependent protein